MTKPPSADESADTLELGSARTIASEPRRDERREEIGSAHTVMSEGRPTSESLPQVELDAGRSSPASDRYLDRRLLGEGGMGEVRLVRDAIIGRDVARKTLRGQATAHALDRFLREARVQAQLEHPAVVPVYDLGVAADGQRWFTMKRVRGRSLESILDGLRAGDVDTTEAFPQRRLLNAFVQVCLAMEYAHARGVLHRDLKPGNVMLGDFGEVHVLDWGLARVRGVPEPAGEERTSLEVAQSAAGQTVDGALLGTPGYMAPEQARGQLDRLDARADVYALGAILFELMFLEPLHGQPTAMARLTQTVMGPSPKLAERERFGEVAPELVTLIEEAIALEPSERPSSARALATRIERYLDGERDAARRRELSEEHVRAARDHRQSGAQPAALRELGRAIALVPDHPEALAALNAVLTELPSEVPPEARAELEALRKAHALSAARTSMVRLFTWLCAVPLVIAFGVTDWGRGAAILIALLMATGLAITAWRGQHVSAGWALAVGVSSSVALATFSFLLGPFVVVPGLASTNAMFFAMTTEKEQRPAWLALGVLAIAVPFLLALTGLDPHYTVHDDALVIRSTLSHLPLGGVLAFLLLTSLATVITPTLLAGRMRDRLAEAEEKVFLQAWHLRHLLPR